MIVVLLNCLISSQIGLPPSVFSKFRFIANNTFKIQLFIAPCSILPYYGDFPHWFFSCDQKHFLFHDYLNLLDERTKNVIEVFTVHRTHKKNANKLPVKQKQHHQHM